MSRYSTYRAFIHFLYTDTIAFAPLSSAYSHAKDTAELAGLDVGAALLTI